MLWAYLDESESKDGFVFCVAGYVARAEEWAGLKIQWTLRLEKEGIGIFHAADCSNGHGEFKGWPQERRTSLTRDLVDLILRHTLVGFIYGVECQPYQSIVGSVLEQRARNLYIICLMPMLKAMADTVAACDASHERIAFVYEERAKTAGVVTELFNAIKSGNDHVFPFPNRDRLESISAMAATHEDAAMLQVADLLAYEGSKHLYNEKFHPEIHRKAMERLRTQVRDASWLPAESMKTLTAWLRERE